MALILKRLGLFMLEVFMIRRPQRQPDNMDSDVYQPQRQLALTGGRGAEEDLFTRIHGEPFEPTWREAARRKPNRRTVKILVVVLAALVAIGFINKNGGIFGALGVVMKGTLSQTGSSLASAAGIENVQNEVIRPSEDEVKTEFIAQCQASPGSVSYSGLDVVYRDGTKSGPGFDSFYRLNYTEIPMKISGSVVMASKCLGVNGRDSFSYDPATGVLEVTLNQPQAVVNEFDFDKVTYDEKNIHIGKLHRLQDFFSQDGGLLENTEVFAFAQREAKKHVNSDREMIQKAEAAVAAHFQAIAQNVPGMSVTVRFTNKKDRT